MVDVNKCRMAYDDNEDEYEDFYVYAAEVEGAEGKELVVGSNAPADAMVAGGYELVVPNEDGGAKILGTREFARYYKQRGRVEDTRDSVQVNMMLARYRSLGIATIENAKTLAIKKMTQKSAMDFKWEGKRNVRTAEWGNFVKELGKGCGSQAQGLR